MIDSATRGHRDDRHCPQTQLQAHKNKHPHCKSATSFEFTSFFQWSMVRIQPDRLFLFRTDIQSPSSIPQKAGLNNYCEVFKVGITDYISKASICKLEEANKYFDLATGSSIIIR